MLLKFNYLLNEITELGEAGGYFFLFMLITKATPANAAVTTPIAHISQKN